MLSLCSCYGHGTCFGCQITKVIKETVKEEFGQVGIRFLKEQLGKAITIDQVLNLLNEATELDPDAMTALVQTRVPCNEALADHPTIQVDEDSGKTSVGLLGILNGLFGTTPDGWGVIAAAFEIKCPNGHELVLGRPGEPCSRCGAILELGKLTRWLLVASENGKEGEIKYVERASEH